MAPDAGPREDNTEVRRNQASKANIVVVGGTNVGKTTFFAVLDRALRDQGFSLHAQREASEAASTELTGSQFLYRIREHLTQGYFPLSTSPLARPASFEFTITGPGPLGTITLSFLDPPGEAFEPTRHGDSDEQDGLTEVEKKKISRVRDNVRTMCEKANALLVLIDLNKPPEIILENWRYTLEQFVDVALEAGQLRRLALVFTKADVLAWQDRARQRFADSWLEAHPDLSAIYRDAKSLRPMEGRDGSRGPTNADPPTVGFFFSSSIGWAYGSPNCRTIIRPRMLDDRTVESAKEWNDLIPDPAIYERIVVAKKDGEKSKSSPVGKKRSGLARGSLPHFIDPLRLVQEELNPKYLEGEQNPIGVLTLPGRHPPRHAQGRMLHPWNVIEPLFWAGGIGELLSHSYWERTRRWES